MNTSPVKIKDTKRAYRIFFIVLTVLLVLALLLWTVGPFAQCDPDDLICMSTP